MELVRFAFFLAHLSTCSRGAFRMVMCPSCIVNNFFKHLLPNCWANLDQTWQKCSLGGPLQKLSTDFDSIENSGCHGNEMEFFKPFPHNDTFWRPWETSLLKTLWEKEKLLVMSNSSSTHSVFYLFGLLSSIFVKFQIVVCKLFQFGRV